MSEAVTTTRDKILAAVALCVVIGVGAALVLAIGWLTERGGTLLGYDGSLGWWVGAYFVVGAVLASLSALAAFGFSWWASAEKWGGICFVFGWLPAGIIAFISWWAVLVLWGPALLGWWAWSSITNR